MTATAHFPLAYQHVDVFAARPFTGNSLAVFADAADLSPGQMQAITREMRHFESIFLAPLASPGEYRVRVFDLNEELDFAGHPLLGAACVLHAETGSSEERSWTLHLNARTVTVRTARLGPDRFAAILDQGAPEFLGTPGPHLRGEIARWFSLSAADLDPELPPEVVSTGLRYLVVPVMPAALERARIIVPDLEHRLAGLGAQFAYLVDASSREGRHWNNDGVIEDVATGSGAGTVAAYLVRHGRIEPGAEWILHQGRFTGRPSEIRLQANGSPTAIHSILVKGEVALVAEGSLVALPGEAL
ncbi:MAG TPA: PhzF family phenazine biosynthesis protein [Gemmatimonadales bacterium]|nr:PhzF family phenazine biosynthesis protein [Gemmatimonadales bacterium]